MKKCDIPTYLESVHFVAEFLELEIKSIDSPDDHSLEVSFRTILLLPQKASTPENEQSSMYIAQRQGNELFYIRQNMTSMRLFAARFAKYLIGVVFPKRIQGAVSLGVHEEGVGGTFGLL